MDIDELLARNGDLTPEEFAFLEEETLKLARAFAAEIDALLPKIAAQDPQMADKLEVQSQIMLANIEAAAAIPLDARDVGKGTSRANKPD